MSVRIGDNQKLSKAGTRSFKFPKALVGQHRFGKIDIYRRLGGSSVVIDEAAVDCTQEVSIPCDGFGEDLKFRVELTPPEAVEKVIALQSNLSKLKESRVTDAMGYLENHNIEMRLSDAMQACLRERPEDPAQFIAVRLLQNRGLFKKIPKLKSKRSGENIGANITTPQLLNPWVPPEVDASPTSEAPRAEIAPQLLNPWVPPQFDSSLTPEAYSEEIVPQLQDTLVPPENDASLALKAPFAETCVVTPFSDYVLQHFRVCTAPCWTDLYSKFAKADLRAHSAAVTGRVPDDRCERRMQDEPLADWKRQARAEHLRGSVDGFIDDLKQQYTSGKRKPGGATELEELKKKVCDSLGLAAVAGELVQALHESLKEVEAHKAKANLEVLRTEARHDFLLAARNGALVRALQSSREKAQNQRTRTRPLEASAEPSEASCTTGSGWV